MKTLSKPGRIFIYLKSFNSTIKLLNDLIRLILKNRGLLNLMISGKAFYNHNFLLIVIIKIGKNIAELNKIAGRKKHPHK